MKNPIFCLVSTLFLILPLHASPASAPPGSPEIDVFLSARREMKDGISRVNFGPVPVGEVSKARTFTIKNVGFAPLKGVTVRKGGKNRAGFKVIQPSTKFIPAKKSATFTVAFRPLVKGEVASILVIDSNDPDENPFEIHVVAEGLPKRASFATPRGFK